ncbi:MAG: hypothetical protein KAJ19_14480 [Gammaproteobacteria bacterium]|nr:hypothetical protein [Gammaproteobacteria bacterium]
MAKKITFTEWHKQLYELAKANHCEFLIPLEEDYPHDGFDDENTPAEELSDLISYSNG